MKLFPQELAAFTPTMTVKHPKIKDLRIPQRAIGAGALSFPRDPRSLASRQTNGHPLRKGRNPDSPCLVRVLIVVALAARVGRPEVVLGAAKRDPDDGQIAAGHVGG